jgi:hypothetical protein
MTFHPGDTVKFLVPFRNADTIIETGYLGVVERGIGPFNFIAVIAKRQLWLCRPGEIRVVGTETKTP